MAGEANPKPRCCRLIAQKLLLLARNICLNNRETEVWRLISLLSDRSVSPESGSWRGRRWLKRFGIAAQARVDFSVPFSSTGSDHNTKAFAQQPSQ